METIGRMSNLKGCRIEYVYNNFKKAVHSNCICDGNGFGPKFFFIIQKNLNNDRQKNEDTM